MVATKSNLSQAYLNECFHYDPETGDLTWKTRPIEHFKTKRAFIVNNYRYSGKKAGSKCRNGYIRVKVNDSGYSVHRVVWVITYGCWPNKEIDHINNNREDNRISNLREATRSKNGFNRGAQSNNASGFKGVHFHKVAKKYVAYVGKKHLGTFKTAELAYAAACAAREALHGSFVNHG